jgi:hypothetical protein
MFLLLALVRRQSIEPVGDFHQSDPGHMSGFQPCGDTWQLALEARRQNGLSISIAQ